MSKRAGKQQATVALTPERVLADHTPGVRALAEALRRLIAEAVPEATEVAHPSWHSINYHHPHSGYFCGIFPRPDGVQLALEFGALLPDPDGVLEGMGKQVRYVRLREGQEIPADAIRQLLRAALDLPEGRAAKMALLQLAAKPLHTESG